jgi:hypothetical protein
MGQMKISVALIDFVLSNFDSTQKKQYIISVLKYDARGRKCWGKLLKEGLTNSILMGAKQASGPIP